jgi:hypothetical protein
MTKATLVALLLASGSAFAQSEKPAAKEERPAEQPRKPLNLKLDQPARAYVQETPVDKSADNLPSLGSNSNSPLWDKAKETRPDAPKTPYPQDTERVYR